MLLTQFPITKDRCQSKKRPILPTVHLDETQNFDLAFAELNQKIYHQTASRWYKRRYGYYEKPSLLNRKRKKMKRLLSHRQSRLGNAPISLYGTHLTTLTLKISPQEQFACTGKNAVGH